MKEQYNAWTSLCGKYNEVTHNYNGAWEMGGIPKGNIILHFVVCSFIVDECDRVFFWYLNLIFQF